MGRKVDIEACQQEFTKRHGHPDWEPAKSIPFMGFGYLLKQLVTFRWRKLWRLLKDEVPDA